MRQQKSIHMPHPIHIDNFRPLQYRNSPSRFPSNWELSTYRAIAVVKYFVYKRGYHPTRLSAIGHGEYHPLVPNNTAANRSKNRRIELAILRDLNNE